MKYDTLTPDELRAVIRYCDQQLGKTTSASRRARMTTKRRLLVSALARWEFRQVRPPMGARA